VIEKLHYEYFIVLIFLDVILHENWIWQSYCDKLNYAGNDGNYHASETAKQGTQPVKARPIEVPNIPADELKEVTDNFGQDALIGEGSYGRVYYGVLKSGQAAAIKNLDASKQPDDEFLAQVCIWRSWFNTFLSCHQVVQFP